MSIRFRVLVAVSLLSALSLLLAGLVAYQLERSRLDEQVDASLARRYENVQALARLGVDPSTGQPIEGTHELLRVGVQNMTLNENEGTIALLGESTAWVAAPGVQVRLERDPAFVGEVKRLPRDRSVVSTITTGVSEYRFALIPLTTEGETPLGAIIVASDMQKVRHPLNVNYSRYALVGVASMTLVAVAAWFLIGRTLAPIGWVRRTAQQITETDLSQRIPVRGRDDLSELTVTVNGMLDRLESTFQAQRSLYDDVGHELRTPLTIIRGHLELMDVDDPDDVTATRELAISEVHRMSRLVEDLITLAKADGPGFIKMSEVDVAELTDSTLEKAKALGDRRWKLESVAGVFALLDPERIAQALLELSRNAVKFSEPGSVIALGSQQVGDSLRMWVRDEGMGIPADQIDHVADRFARASSANVEGSGLGLAIVSTIARGHDGRVEVKSVEGMGTTVTLVLPCRPVE